MLLPAWLTPKAASPALLCWHHTVLFSEFSLYCVPTELIFFLPACRRVVSLFIFMGRNLGKLLATVTQALGPVPLSLRTSALLRGNGRTEPSYHFVPLVTPGQTAQVWWQCSHHAPPPMACSLLLADSEGPCLPATLVPRASTASSPGWPPKRPIYN